MQKNKCPLISIIIPAFNEEPILEQSLDSLHSYLESLGHKYDWEIIIVNDGSNDRTGDIAEAFGEKYANVFVLHHMYNYRLGQALRFAFKKTRGDYVVVLDVDLSYEPSHIERMLDKIETTRAKIVIASPYMAGGHVSNVPWVRKMLSKWANRFLSLVATRDRFSDRLTTFTGMVRTYDGPFIRNLNLKAMDVDILPEIIYKAMILRAKIVEIPAHLNWQPVARINSDNHKKRKSSLRIYRSIIQSILSGFMFRPFVFFIVPGVSLLLLSIYPILWSFFYSIKHYREHLNTFRSADYYGVFQAIYFVFDKAPHVFILGGFSLIVGIQLMSLGLQALQQKRYYEELFHLNSMILKKQSEKPDS